MSQANDEEMESLKNYIKSLTAAINDLDNPKYSGFYPKGLDVEIDQLKAALKKLELEKD